jgi:hypothetical protein
MAKRRHDDLAYWRDEVIMIKNRDELELLLACQGAVFDCEDVMFAEPDDDYPAEATTNVFSVASAIDHVVDAGILPAPKRPLPPVGARVETIEVGGKPPPACRYGVGVVRALEWDWIFRTWRVNVKFDQRTGGWCGYPILGTHTFAWGVHLIGSGERPFSEMTPDEIEALHEVRRQQFWREIDPACGLRDPSGIVKPHE